MRLMFMLGLAVATGFLEGTCAAQQNTVLYSAPSLAPPSVRPQIGVCPCDSPACTCNGRAPEFRRESSDWFRLHLRNAECPACTAADRLQLESRARIQRLLVIRRFQLRRVFLAAGNVLAVYLAHNGRRG